MKPYEEYTDNLTIKIDWLSFTVQKSMTPKGVIEYFGMDIEEFKEATDYKYNNLYLLTS